MWQKDAPLKFRFRLDWPMWRWVFKFLYATITGQYSRNTAETIQLGIESRKLYDEICVEEHIENIVFDRSNCGIVC